jgi:lincosamide nucleotidyltransferase A/C/D/E
MERAYHGRHPSAPMDAAALLEVIDCLEGQGVDVWLDGGWGVDALLERETREHDDLDLVAELRDSDRIIE